MTAKEKEEGLERFVMKEIYANQTALIEECFKKDLFSIDDIENMYRSFDANLLDPYVCSRCGRIERVLDSQTGECEECFEENKEPQEILEWWLVSLWFGKKLHMEGEPVLENDYGIWWGRCITGQAIVLDYVIEKIYKDLLG